MLKNKKGFTLVELLAVIVILAIILAIAVPSISDMIKNSKRNAFEADVKLIIKGIDYKILEGKTITVATVESTSDLSDYGANPADYESFDITAITPAIKINLTGKSTGKFGACSTTGATMASVTVTGC